MKYLTVLFFSLTFYEVFGQLPCGGGDQTGDPGGGVPPPGTGWDFPVVTSFDPNDIVPPEMIGDEYWVRRDELLPFMLRCENHPDSATAPVQEAWFYLPFHANVDASLFEFGDIGFGDYHVTVPPGSQSFSTVVNASATLGVKVQITAGIQTSPHRAFWHFVSLDPVTNQPPLDPFLGFLLINDTITHRGEGFANFSIQAKAITQTFDTIATQADIIFDQNPAIATPLIVNTIDADHPVSQVSSTFSAPDPSHVLVNWSGTDVGSGVANYTLFVSVNDNAYEPWLELVDTTAALLPAVLGNNYRLISVARDSVGNVEPVGAPVEFDFIWDGNACVANLVIANATLLSGDYRSLGPLTSSQVTLGPGLDVRYFSDTSILLHSNFTVQTGAVFEAQIEACPTPPSTKKGKSKRKGKVRS